MYTGTNKTALTSQELITQAFLRLLSAKSYEQISIKEICAEADVARQTFYTLFTTKENVLLHEVLTNYQFLTEADPSIKDASPLHRLCRLYSLYLKNNAAFITLLLKNNLAHLLQDSLYTSIKRCPVFFTNTLTEEQLDIAAYFIAGGLTNIAEKAAELHCLEDRTFTNMTARELFSGSIFNTAIVMGSHTIQFKNTDGTDSDFIGLCKNLDTYLNTMVGELKQREQYDKYNTLENIHDVIVAYCENQAIACGSFKKYDDDHAEIKRVFTKDEFRKNGVSCQLVRKLEIQAKMQGYTYCILETGDVLEAAIHMYTHLGYQVIPNYGQYKNMAESVCMIKKI